MLPSDFEGEITLMSIFSFQWLSLHRHPDVGDGWLECCSPSDERLFIAFWASFRKPWLADAVNFWRKLSETPISICYAYGIEAYLADESSFPVRVSTPLRGSLYKPRCNQFETEPCAISYKSKTWLSHCQRKYLETLCFDIRDLDFTHWYQTWSRVSFMWVACSINSKVKTLSGSCPETWETGGGAGGFCPSMIQR